jgi:dephospho-CoA kinase
MRIARQDRMKDGMKIVGLVGQSGTGKTTVAEHLEKNGAGRVDADKIVHEFLRTNDGVCKAIRERFGSDVFSAGEIDRGALGRVVFADPGALEALNRIVHPVVIDACVAKLKAYEASGADLVVLDAALLLEVASPIEIDLVIALRCKREEQMRRLRAMGGRSDEELAARLDAQAHIEESFDRADVVVDTDGPKEEVLDDIDRIIRILLGGV